VNILSKDQGYGFVIFIISVVVGIAYVVAFFSPWIPGLQRFNPSTATGWHEMAVGIPVLLFVLLVLVISGWIGWTMLTTPPPAPLEPEPAMTSAKTSTATPKPRIRRKK
jgi:hypothetical protein